jgi:error-prone DNA polymerase
MRSSHVHPFKLIGCDKAANTGTNGVVHRGPAYAELAVTTNFTFLTGASHPEEFVKQAAQLGHAAAAIADTNTLAGIVRAHVAAKDANIPLAIGARLVLRDGPPIITFVSDRASYARLCRLLTLGKRRTEKGQCDLALHDLIEHSEGLLAVVIPPHDIDSVFISLLHGLKGVFDDDRLSLAMARSYRADDDRRLEQLATLSAHVAVPLVATNEAHYHEPSRRSLQDVLTCIRCGCTLDEAGYRLLPHAEFHLKEPIEMARLFAGYEAAVARSADVALRSAAFSLDELRYEYAEETCPPGLSPIQHLTNIARNGAAERYPDGVPAKVHAQIKRELALIDELNYAPYFLTVHDLVVFARSRGILCQGRGAAANSVVCYCIGVTAVDPERIDLLFERFISKERNEPPDIDIDFEHERREEVIQYIYAKYGRDRAALTAVVITYRGRSAVREVGKVLGLSLDCVDRLAKSMDWWDRGTIAPDRLRELGLNPEDATLKRVATLTGELIGFPRHLSQHVGGFVITKQSLSEYVPIENAAMKDRTVIEWDKDDIDAMGMLKVDCLGLGMLTCIGKAMGMVNWERQRDEETKRRSGRKIDEMALTICEELSDGEYQDLSGSDRVAEGHGTCEGALCNDQSDAERRAIRAHESDAAGGSVCPIEHRRGIWTGKSGGSIEVSTHCERFTQRGINSVRTRDQHADDPDPVDNLRPHRRNGSCPTRLDHKPQKQSLHIDIFSPTSSLRLSVSPSLPPLSLHTIPPEDPLVYDMICEADTIGVFQIESRAQMSMLPRLRPRCFYDLVIEVAIVRPGPIQGKMVHPYLRRRDGVEAAMYPNDDVRRVLGKTLGVPLFQEQAMALAIVAAGFTPGEADQLRRAMAAWKRKGDAIAKFGTRLVEGMLARGYDEDFARRCFEQIKGFSEYGFPESHAASFAHLVYVSCWLKRHHPAAFAAALINSQPMGFYAPAQIVRDAKEHGVRVRPIDVNWSGWDCGLEGGGSDEATERRSDGGGRQRDGEIKRRSGESDAGGGRLGWGARGPAIRLGMRLVRGLRCEEADAIAEAVRQHGPFQTIEHLRRASGATVGTLRRLARADAFGSMGLDRQQALWQVRNLRDDPLPLFDMAVSEEAEDSGCAHTASNGEHEALAQDESSHETVVLPSISPQRLVEHDYSTAGLSLKAHPISFARTMLDGKGAITASVLADESRSPGGRRVSVAGLILVRQRPMTASGMVFMTLEDETGLSNLIVRPHIYERYRRVAKHSKAILARGAVERAHRVVHVMVTSMESLDDVAEGLRSRSRDFR